MKATTTHNKLLKYTLIAAAIYKRLFWDGASNLSISRPTSRLKLN